VVRVDEPTDRDDCDHVGPGARQGCGGALGSGAGGVGVVEHEHSPARDGDDGAKAPWTGAKVPERLGTLDDHRRHAQIGLCGDGRSEQSDEWVLPAPGRTLLRARRDRDGEGGELALEDLSDQAAKMEAEEVAHETGQRPLAFKAGRSRWSGLVPDEQLMQR
jgi:hypothetical protein